MMFEPVARVKELRKRFNHKMFTSGIGTFRGFEELEAKALADGALPRRDKELAAIGMSIVAGCYGCIEYHVTAALEQGATRDQVAEMAALAICMGGGTAQWAARYVFDVLDQLEQGAGAGR